MTTHKSTRGYLKICIVDIAENAFTLEEVSTFAFYLPLCFSIFFREVFFFREVYHSYVQESLSINRLWTSLLNWYILHIMLSAYICCNFLHRGRTPLVKTILRYQKRSTWNLPSKFFCWLLNLFVDFFKLVTSWYILYFIPSCL